MGVISKYFSLCKNFHSKSGMGVNSDMGVIERERERVRYIVRPAKLGPTHSGEQNQIQDDC